LGKFLDRHDLGDVGGADATMRLMPGLVRVPDVSFVGWEKLPGRQRPTEPVPDLVPDLAIEVLSEGNTRGELRRKLKDYFLSGVRVVWFLAPRRRTVGVFTAPDSSVAYSEDQVLDGGAVLPGLALAVRDVFARVPPVPPRAPRQKKPGTSRRPPG